MADIKTLPEDNLHNEPELLQRIAQGNEQAFNLIYSRYFPKVYAMSLSYIPDAFTAKDIVQESFARVWLNRSQLQDIQNFEAWLITVTRNLLIKHLRKTYPPGWQPEEQVSGGNPYESLDYRELEKSIGDAINKLSARQREVYQLSRVEGYSHKEIAHKLDISIDVSREHLSKALHKIRAFLLEKYRLLSIFLYFF